MANEYRWGIITFFDILGFRNIVKEFSCDEIYRLFNVFNHFVNPSDKLTREDHVESELKIICFSDSVIRILPVDSKQNLNFRQGILFHELLDLIHIQGELVNKGILVRGGVVLGEAFFQDGSWFGQGIVDAYDLESKVAKAPRIIIHNDLIKGLKQIPLLQDQMNSLNYQLSEVNQFIMRDEQDIAFLNYLEVMKSEADSVNVYNDFLMKHREIILKGLQSKDQNTLEKYLWLKQYHNTVINKLHIGNAYLIGQ